MFKAVGIVSFQQVNRGAHMVRLGASKQKRRRMGKNDASRAAYLFRRAAKFESGDGQRIEPERSIALYLEAAALGHPGAARVAAYTLIASRSPRDWAVATRLLRRLAGQGDTDAQRTLARCYRLGRGVPSDTSRAIFWYRRAAASGGPGPVYELAVCYHQGEGVKRDPKRAATLYEAAAQKGHESAQYEIGLAYANGDGVRRDPGAAARWLRRAAKQGHKRAARELAALLRRVPPTAQRKSAGRGQRGERSRRQRAR